MKTLIKKFFDNEILSYLFFGVATTIVSVGTRLFIYHVSRDERLATAIGNIAGILFAFATNDTIVFKQERKGWFQRLIRFAIARSGTFILDMALTEIFVKQFPGIIGQFVHNNKLKPSLHKWPLLSSITSLVNSLSLKIKTRLETIVSALFF